MIEEKEREEPRRILSGKKCNPGAEQIAAKIADVENRLRKADTPPAEHGPTFAAEEIWD
ncbi:hypothetical protein JNW90_14915 [Micromonospora sp. STR1s_5]|nr:hypothetical protein [Micromonospora sp. STR1s_5]